MLLLFRVTNLQMLWNSPTISSTPAHVKLYSNHAGTKWMVLNTYTDTNATNNKQFLVIFPDKIFSWHFPDL